MGFGGSIRRCALFAGASAIVLAVGIVAGTSSGRVPSASAAGTLHAVKVGTFQRAVYPAQAPGQPKLLFVVEQTGRVMVVDHGTTRTRPFLDIRNRVLAPGEPGGFAERGLLSIAFAP